jgi:hypothetical protein
MSERTDGAAYFRLFAHFARTGHSPLYERLTLAAAEDPQMLALAAKARAGQPQANILFGAVHALLLSGVDDPLKDYYPSCGGNRAANDGDAYAVFKEFVANRHEALVPIIASRLTNTNEVGRSALIYPALDLIARESGSALQLIEIGPSAGLNVNWRRYGYRYTDESGAVVMARGGKPGLVLESRLVGPGRLALAPELPEIAMAFGLEQSPVDPAVESEKLWLRALIWPERLDRLARLDAALAIAAAHPPRIVNGNAVRDLTDYLAAIPGRSAVTIIHTLVTYQFDEPAQRVFEAAILQASRARPIYRVSVESDRASCPLELSRYEGAGRERRRLAECDPHGGWIEWLVG